MMLLIVNINANYIKQKLEPKFPDLTIHAASTEDEAKNFIEHADILLTIRATDDFMKRAKKLQWIQCMITGVDYLINLPSLRKDILITSTRGIHGPQMSELAFLMMLSLNRNFSQNILNQQKRNWDRWPGSLLLNKKVGILGVGVIGQEIARKCKAFGMTVYGITTVKRQIDSVDYSYGQEDLLEVMREVDFFINVVPHTPQTDKMIGTEAFSVMKPTAYFINIGRGGTVDEDAMLKALREKVIAGAALDVFEIEPLPEDSPFWELDNVVITPHIGGMSDIYADQVLPIFEENLKRYLKGERRDLVNFIEW